jgi:hypothetical protein
MEEWKNGTTHIFTHGPRYELVRYPFILAGYAQFLVEAVCTVSLMEDGWKKMEEDGRMEEWNNPYIFTHGPRCELVRNPFILDDYAQFVVEAACTIVTTNGSFAVFLMKDGWKKMKEWKNTLVHIKLDRE